MTSWPVLFPFASFIKDYLAVNIDGLTGEIAKLSCLPHDSSLISLLSSHLGVLWYSLVVIIYALIWIGFVAMSLV